MPPVPSDSKLVPAEGIRVGANGTFNSKAIVPWFLLTNDLKSLCPVAELLYSWSMLVILHREPGDGSLACGIAADGLLACSGTPLPLPEFWSRSQLRVALLYFGYGQLQLALTFYSSFSHLSMLS